VKKIQGIRCATIEFEMEYSASVHRSNHTENKSNVAISQIAKTQFDGVLSNELYVVGMQSDGTGLEDYVLSGRNQIIDVIRLSMSSCLYTRGEKCGLISHWAVTYNY